MYGLPSIPQATAFSNFLGDSPSPDAAMATSAFPFPQLAGAEFESLTEMVCAGSSSGCSSYNSPISMASCSAGHEDRHMQRSVSSHSLLKNGLSCHFGSGLNEFLDSHSGPVRRVFSTGDLHQGMNTRRSESPLSNESAIIIEGMSKACRYGPEEKKERIERYRSKRNQRNFNKTIKYACRKTLADSRPRIRGRFARNEKMEKTLKVQWSQMGGEEEEEDDNWVNLLESFSANMIP